MFSVPQTFDPNFYLPEVPEERPRIVPLRPRRVPEAPVPPVVNDRPLADLPPLALEPNRQVPPEAPLLPASASVQPMDGPSAAVTPVVPLRPRVVPDMESVDTNPTDETRQRYIGDETQRQIDNREKFLHDPSLRNAPENRPGRIKAGVGMFLNEAGNAARALVDRSIQTGRPITWGDFGMAVSSGGGAGLSGAVQPKLLADLEHQTEIARLKQQQAEEHARKAQQLDEKARLAAIGHTIAQTNDLNAQNKPQAKERDQLIGIWKDLDEFSPETNPELAQRWQAAFGYPAPSKTKGDQTQLITRPDGVYLVNKRDRTVSRVDGIPDDRVTMTFNGQTFKVTEAQAVNALATAGQQGVAAQNTNAGYEQDWAEAERKRLAAIPVTQAKIDTATANELRLGQRLGVLADRKQAMIRGGAEASEIEQIDKEYRGVEDDIQKARAARSVAQAELNTLNVPTPKRTPNTAPAAPTISRPSATVPRATAKQRLIDAGYTEDEADAALRARGY